MKYYCSKIVQQEIAIQTESVWKEQNKICLDFLQEFINKWEDLALNTEFISCSPIMVSSSDNKIKIEQKFKEVIIYFNDIPRIREIRWFNLLELAKVSFNFPNPYLRIDTNLVTTVVDLVKAPTVGITYRALLMNYPEQIFEENIIDVLKSGLYVPTEQDLENQEAVFIDNYVLSL